MCWVSPDLAMSEHVVQSNIEPYLRKLVRLCIQPSTESSAPASVIVLPKCFVPEDLPTKWNLSEQKKNKGGIQLRVMIITTRKWGKDTWQWQACASAGGVISVLSNNVNSIQPPPVDRLHYLYLS